MTKKKANKPHNSPIVNPSDSNKSLQYLTRYGEWMFDEPETDGHYTTNDQWKQRLINTLRLFAEDKDSLEIRQFTWDYRVPYKTLERVRKENPKVQQAYEDCMAMLGTRKKIEALKKRFDKDMVMKDLHVYLPEFKEVNEYHRMMKTEEQEKPTKLVIEMQQTPSSPVVKDRNEAE